MAPSAPSQERNMKLPATIAAFALLVAPALAAPADGCAGITTIPSDDDTGVSVLFSEMLVTLERPAVACDVSTPLSEIPLVPDTAEGAILAYSSDYRVDGREGDRVQLRVDENGVIRNVVADVSADPDRSVILHSFVTPDGDGKLNSDILFQLLDGDEDSNTELTSLDYGFLGYTTLGLQAASVEQLASAQTTLVTQLNTTAGLILSANQPLERDDQVGLLGAVGSHTVGLTTHLNLDYGLSIDAGAALFEQSVGNASASGVMLGGKLGYLQPEDGGAFRWLGNVGVAASPGMNLSFSRSYTLFGAGDDFAPVATSGNATGNGTMIGTWLEGGVLIAPDPSNEIILSASYARNWLSLDDAGEEQTDSNPFAASLGSSTSTYDTLKAKAAWTTSIAPNLDLTAHGAIGYTFAPEELAIDVALVGPLTVAGQDEAFAEYGARLGWSVTDSTEVGAFVLGSTGSVTGTHMQVGTSLSMKF